MAKSPPVQTETYVVSDNGSSKSWEVEATDPADAVARVRSNHNLKRDTRNFTAVLKAKLKPASAPAVQPPSLPNNG